MTLNEWIATLTEQQRADLSVLCSCCGMFQRGAYYYSLLNDEHGSGELWVDRVPPAFALVCGECNGELDRLRAAGHEVNHATLMRLSKRMHPTAAYEHLERIERIEAERAKHRHLRVVE